MHANPVETTLSNEAIEWFSKLHSGQATPEDYAGFEAWRQRSPAHAQAYGDIEQLWASLDAPARRVFQEEEARAAKTPRPRARIHPAASSSKPVRRALIGLSLAVMLALGLGLPSMLRLWTSDYHTGWGERRDFTLADGSQITLNTHTALKVEFSEERRLVKLLEGEAYFQVTPDPTRPFVVVTAHSMARVTGTAFNVYQQAEQTTITVTTGRVRVHSGGQESQAVELHAGSQVSGDGRGLGPVLAVDGQEAVAWRSGLLVFTLQPLSAVVAELNRYVPGKIVLADPRIRARIVSGAFDLSHPREVVSAIERTLALASLNLPGSLTVLYQPSL